MSNTTIVFTRHANSCNNFKDNKGKSLGFMKTSDVLKDIEPGLTIYGIVSALKRSKNIEHKSNIIFVSRLVRTWMTAILLYLPHISNNDTLYLVISPFLTEVIKGANDALGGTGNIPICFKQQLYKILYFLQFLYTFKDNLYLSKDFFSKKIEILFVITSNIKQKQSIIIDLNEFNKDSNSLKQYFNELLNNNNGVDELNYILTSKSDSLIETNFNSNYCTSKNTCISDSSDRKLKKCEVGIDKYIDLIYNGLNSTEIKGGSWFKKAQKKVENIVSNNEVSNIVISNSDEMNIDINNIKPIIQYYPGSINDFKEFDLNRFISEFVRLFNIQKKN